MARSLRLSSEERDAMGKAMQQHLRNAPVRLQAGFRHPLRTMAFLESLFPARFLRLARPVRLGTDERTEMRGALLKHMRTVPISPAVAVEREEVVFLHPRFLVPAVATFMLFVGGVSYAAEGAMPQDILYPFKILVNESFVDALNFTPEARARGSVGRVVRRLDEAVTLAASDRLDADRSALIRAKFTVQAEQAEERIRSLLRRGLQDAALEVLTTFEVSLETYGMTLADLAGSETNLAKVSEELRRTVDEEERRVAASGSAVVSDIVSRGRSVDGAVHAASRETEVHLKRMRATTGKLLPQFKTHQSVRIDASVESAQSHLHEADARLSAGESTEALRAAKDGLRYAEAADLLLKVEQMKVGRSRSLPDWNINFVPGTRRELRERTEVREERERIKKEKEARENGQSLP